MPLHPDNAARFLMFESALDALTQGMGVFDGCAPVIVACKTTSIAMTVSKQMRQWLDDRGTPYLPVAPREIVLGASPAGPALIFARPSPHLLHFRDTSDLFVDISLTDPQQEMIEMHTMGSPEPKLVPGKTTHEHEFYVAGSWHGLLDEWLSEQPGSPLSKGLDKKKKLNSKLFGKLPKVIDFDNDLAEKNYVDKQNPGFVGWDGMPHLHPGYDDQHVSSGFDMETYAAKDFYADPLEAMIEAANEIHEASKKGPTYIPFQPPVEFELTEDIVKGDWRLLARVQLGPKILKAGTMISAGCIGKGPGMWDGTIDHPFLDSLKDALKATLEAKIAKAIVEASDTVVSMDQILPDGVEDAKVQGGKVTFDLAGDEPDMTVAKIEGLPQPFDAKEQISTFQEIIKTAMGLKGVVNHEGTKEHLLAQLKAIHFAQAYGAKPKVSDLIDAVFPATKKTPRTLHLIDGLGRKRVLEWDVDLLPTIDLPHPLPPGFVDSDPKNIIPPNTPIVTFVLDEETKDEPIVTYWERV